MRPLLVDVLVLVACCWALWWPRLGLYAWIAFSITRPDIFAYADSTKPYRTALMVATAIGSSRYLGHFCQAVKNWMSLTLFILTIARGVSVLTAVNPALSYTKYGWYLEAVFMTVLITVYVKAEHQFKQLLFVLACSLGLIGMDVGLTGLLHGGIRFSDGFGSGLLSGNNEVGMAMAMAVPICYHLSTGELPRWLKVSMLVMAASCVATVIMTYSRGAALGLIACVLTVIARSRHRIRALLLLCASTIPVVCLVGNSYLDRLATLQDPHAEASAASRFVMAGIAMRIWKDYPLTGVGFGQLNFIAIENKYVQLDSPLVAHNSYLQTLADSGIVALGIYAVLLFGGIWCLGRSARRVALACEKLAIVPAALQGSLVAFAVSSTFGSFESWDLYYIILMTGAAWLMFEQRILRDVRETSMHEMESTLQLQ